MIRYDKEELKQESMPVITMEEGRALIKRLKAEAKKHKGCVGLAAPQIGELKKVFIVDAGDGFKGYINPQIIDYSMKKDSQLEGCVSFPGLKVNMLRSLEIIVLYNEPTTGELVDKVISGWEARIFQHEYDHLLGVTIDDSLERMLHELV
jgi:peptide deformylase